MSARSAFLLLLSGLYFWLCDYLYTCRIKQVCYGCQSEQTIAVLNSPSSKTPPATAVISEPTEPLMFKWSDPKPILSEHFEHFRASIAGRMQGQDLLEITGLYFQKEKNTSSFENLGLARANQIKALFIQQIPEARIVLKSKLISEPADVRTVYFESADFYWIPDKQANK